MHQYDGNRFDIDGKLNDVQPLSMQEMMEIYGEVHSKLHLITQSSPEERRNLHVFPQQRNMQSVHDWGTTGSKLGDADSCSVLNQ